MTNDTQEAIKTAISGAITLIFILAMVML